VVVATARALAARGTFADDEAVVLYITGNGYKGALAAPSLRPAIAADADDFRAAYAAVLA
jgi:threonine synthase